MKYAHPRWLVFCLVAVGTASLAAPSVPQAGPEPVRPADAGGQRPVFRSGVDLVHVTVTVTDGDGRFVRGLKAADFRLTEDGIPQEILQFSSQRAPVSLGIALDTSASMLGSKIREARAALHRVLGELLEPSDEVFLYTFGDAPTLRQGWTTDRRALADALAGVRADGRTALYDTVDQALALMESARYRKRVLLVVSDGNDTASFTPLPKLRERISGSEALVYAIGIDSSESRLRGGSSRYTPRTGWEQLIPRPRFPPRRPPVGRPGPTEPPPWSPPAPPRPAPPVPQLPESANIQALRELTDLSGGRTEVVRTGLDLAPATASVADELSRQYLLVYRASAARDGRWHAIDVTLVGGTYNVRARRGYLAATR